MMLTSLNGPDKLSSEQLAQMIRCIRSDGIQKLTALEMAEVFFPITAEQRSTNKENQSRRACEKQALAVLDELCTKQAGLVEDMNYVQEKYILALKSSNRIMSNTEQKIIFRNWNELLEVHKQLSEGIKMRAEDQVVSVWLRRIFDEFLKFLPKATEAMKKFAQGVNPAEDAFDDLLSRGNESSNTFKTFLDLRLKDDGAFSAGNAPRGLRNLLIAPIHSFLRYRLFFTEMLKILKQCEYGYITLIRDLEEMSRLSERSNTEINEIVARAKRKRDNLKRFDTLQQQYNPSVEMLSTERQFYFMLPADITINSQTSSGELVGAYCYSDMLILVLKDRMEYFVYRDVVTRKHSKNSCDLHVLRHTNKKSKAMLYELTFHEEDDNSNFLDHCLRQRQNYFKDHRCYEFWCVI